MGRGVPLRRQVVRPGRRDRGTAIAGLIRRAAGRPERSPVLVNPQARAGHVQRRLASIGLRGCKVPDLIVAAVAEGVSLTVLHYDADFDHIAKVTEQPVEWVVPLGSVD